MSSESYYLGLRDWADAKGYEVEELLEAIEKETLQAKYLAKSTSGDSMEAFPHYKASCFLANLDAAVEVGGTLGYKLFESVPMLGDDEEPPPADAPREEPPRRREGGTLVTLNDILVSRDARARYETGDDDVKQESAPAPSDNAYAHTVGGLMWLVVNYSGAKYLHRGKPNCRGLAEGIEAAMAARGIEAAYSTETMRKALATALATLSEDEQDSSKGPPSKALGPGNTQKPTDHK